MSLRIKYIDAPQGAREAAQFEGTGQPFSDVRLLSSSLENVAYATLEPAGWPLDGSRSIMPDDIKTGFWSTNASDTETSILSPAPVITMMFPERYTATGLTIIFALFFIWVSKDLFDNLSFTLVMTPASIIFTHLRIIPRIKDAIINRFG